MEGGGYQVRGRKDSHTLTDPIVGVLAVFSWFWNHQVDYSNGLLVFCLTSVSILRIARMG